MFLNILKTRVQLTVPGYFELCKIVNCIMFISSARIILKEIVNNHCFTCTYNLCFLHWRWEAIWSSTVLVTTYWTVWHQNPADRTISVFAKVAVFWFVVPWSIVEVYQCSRDRCCPHHQGSRGIRDLWNFFMFTSVGTSGPTMYPLSWMS